jgi:hypothetical protein
MTGNRTPSQDSRETCETLEQAEQVAYICAAYQQPCGLVVCDAYHRLLLDASAGEAARARELVMLAADSA